MSDDIILFERINLFVLGNAAVGKTSFILRYCENEFKDNYLSTVGIDFLAKTVILPNNREGKICFYDTAGEEKYRAISFNLIKTADGIILMYDITSQKSFEAISGWINSIKEVKGEDFPIVLIGNKCDKEEEREVGKEEGENEAEKYNFGFFETSNKDGINVENAVMDLISKVIKKRNKKQSKKEKNKITLNKRNDRNQTKGCC